MKRAKKSHYARAVDHFDRLRNSKSPLTLNEAYALRGYVTVASTRQCIGTKRVVRNGRIVATKSFVTGWYWLARLDRKVAALRAERSKKKAA